MRRWLVLTIICLTAAACTVAPRGCDVLSGPRTPPESASGLVFVGPSTAPGEDVVVVVRGTEFALPPRHIRSASVGGRAGFIVLARWPGMEGVTPETVEEFARAGNGDVISIFVEATNASGAEAVGNWVNIKLTQAVGPTEQHYTNIGLTQFRAVGMREGWAHNEGREDYYVPSGQTSPTVHMFCDSLLAVPARRRNCTQVSMHRDIKVETTFDYSLLPEWQAILERSTSLLDRFVNERGG